jgi:hypothetical protein
VFLEALGPFLLMVFIRHVKVLTLMELPQAQGSTAPLPSSRNIPAAQWGGPSAASDIDTSGRLLLRSVWPFINTVFLWRGGSDRKWRPTGVMEQLMRVQPRVYQKFVILSIRDGSFLFARSGPSWNGLSSE